MLRHIADGERGALAFVPSRGLLMRRLRALGRSLPPTLRAAVARRSGQRQSSEEGDAGAALTPAQLRAFLLPLAVYGDGSARTGSLAFSLRFRAAPPPRSGDTAYMVELFRRMKGAGAVKAPSAAALRRHLGPYAGISAGIALSCRLFRGA
eukprot:gene4646-4968_t